MKDLPQVTVTREVTGVDRLQTNGGWFAPDHVTETLRSPGWYTSRVPLWAYTVTLSGPALLRDDVTRHRTARRHHRWVNIGATIEGLVLVNSSVTYPPVPDTLPGQLHGPGVLHALLTR